MQMKVCLLLLSLSSVRWASSTVTDKLAKGTVQDRTFLINGERTKKNTYFWLSDDLSMFYWSKSTTRKDVRNAISEKTFITVVDIDKIAQEWSSGTKTFRIHLLSDPERKLKFNTGDTNKCIRWINALRNLHQGKLGPNDPDGASFGKGSNNLEMDPETLLFKYVQTTNIASQENTNKKLVDLLKTRTSWLTWSYKWDINVVDGFGRTALSYACQNGNVQAVKLLIDCGTNVNLLDNSEKSAEYYAKHNQKHNDKFDKYNQILKILNKVGALSRV